MQWFYQNTVHRWWSYLPREFTAIVIVAVYIPPCANTKDALRELYSAISEQQTNNPDGFFIVAGDFNHANLKTVLPKFYQHVNFAIRGNNTLDCLYNSETRIQSWTPPSPRVLRPTFCYANPSIQTTSQTGSKPPVVTLSPLFALDTFHTLLCVHNPTKRQNNIWRCFSLHMYSIHLKYL